MTFCKPWNAGLASETPAVERRLGRLLTAMDTEINANIVEGAIVQWLHEKRFELVGLLEKEGWTMSYDGGDRLKVRAPGHKRPFARRQVSNG